MADRPAIPLPGNVVAVAALCIVAGAVACYDMLPIVEDGRVNINLGFVSLPLGIGVLIRSNGSRVVLAALLLLLLAIVPLGMCVIFSVGVLGGGQLHFTWRGEPTTSPAGIALAVVTGLAMWCLMLWMYRVLRSERTRAAFGLEPRATL